MALCRLCLEEKKLIGKSHIIPDFLYKNSGMYDEKHQFFSFSLKELTNGKKPRKVFTGEFEGGLLCSECDNSVIGQYEDYSKRVLYGGLKNEEAPECKNFINNDGKKFSICRNVDYKKYKLFMLSMLWRMGISRRSFFESVKLGGHEEQLRQMIYKGTPGKFYEYPIFSYHYLNDPTVPKDLIVEPILYADTERPRILQILPGSIHIFNLTNNPDLFPLDELYHQTINESNEVMFYEIEQGMTMDFIKKISRVR